MSLIYSNLKIFQHPEHLAALSSREIKAPVHVRIKPTNVCNHSCWFCAYRSEDLELGKNMRIRDFIPREKMLEIIEDLGRMGVQALTLSGGGEPLVYPYIEEMLNVASEQNLQIGILSNGSRLDGRLADQIKRLATWIRISIDAWDDESYSRSRKVRPGEFNKIIENIRVFNSTKGRALLSVSYIIDRDAAPHVFEFSRLMKSIGVCEVKLSPVIVENDGAQQNLYHAPVERIVDEQIKMIERELVDSTFRVANHYHRQNESFKKSYGRCSFSQMMTVIGADQKVYFCQDKAYTDSGLLGDLSATTFREMWSSKSLRERLNGINPSKECNHHCVAHGKNLLLEEFLSVDQNHNGFV